MMPTPKKRKPMDYFKMAMGLGTNWIDLDSGIIYMIQEYKEALDNPEVNPKPTKIRMVRAGTGEEIGWADEYTVAEKMKDPKEDPRYAPETPREHRKNW